MHDAVRHSARAILRDAVLAAGLSAALALGANAIRSNGLPLVATTEYEVLVPCPEALGDVEGMSPGDPLLAADGTIVIDAGSAEEYAAWHLPGARSVPFDWLEPSPLEREVVRELLRARPQRIVLYGDGDDPDSGATFAGLIAGQGLRNVFFVSGGRAALQAAGGAR